MSKIRLRKCHTNLYTLFGKETVVEVLKNGYGNWGMELYRKNDKRIYKPDESLIGKRGFPTLEAANEVACELIDHEDELQFIRSGQRVLINH